MKVLWLLTVATLCLSGACSAERRPGDSGAAIKAQSESMNIQWRIVGNYTPLSVNRVKRGWVGDSRELLSHGDISLMSHEQRAMAELAAQARSLPDSRMIASGVADELAALHLHYREVIDSYAYAANGHTRLTPLFDMTSVDQWRDYVPSDPYVPTEWFPVEVTASGLSPPCQWRVGELAHHNLCEPIAFAAAAAAQQLSVIDASGIERGLTIEPSEITLLALGDAQIAGEGIGHWHDVQCHRSALSWPFLLAARLARADPHLQVNVISRACAGAEIRHMLDEAYTGVEQPVLTVGARGVEVPARIRRPQLAAAVADLCGHRVRDCELQLQQPDYLLVSAGAADLRYHQTIAQVLHNRDRASPALDRRALDELASDYLALAGRIRTRFPGAKVIMSNYLDPLHRDDQRLCSDGSAFARHADRGWLEFLSNRLLGWRDRDQSQMRLLQRRFVLPALRAIEQIGQQLEDEYPGDWYFVATAAHQPDGNRADGFEVSGFCNRGAGARGAWFAPVDASATPRRVIAANLFAQLFVADKVYRQICAIDEHIDCAG